MFLVLQFPFADARGFLEKDAGRLSLPAWPLANAGKDFIRSSGVVRPRLKGGVEDWPGEELFGDASNAIKFPDHLQHIPISLNGSNGSLRCAFRRFYSDGVSARLDVGINVDFAKELNAAEVDLVGLLRQVVELNVRVAGSPPKSCTKLIDAGDQLARHFLRSTTDRKQVASDVLQGWWFSAGLPSLIVEYSGAFKVPAYTKRVANVEPAGAELSHSWLQSGKQRFSAWFIEKGLGDQDALRRLRIHLVRLHAERECLKCILQHLRQSDRLPRDRDTFTSERIQLYLRDALRVLNKPLRYGNDQAALLEAAQYAFGQAFAGETASLGSMRRQISLQVESYIRAQNGATVVQNINGNYMNTNIQMGNVNVTNGDFTVATAENITNSFNKAASSDANTELKEQLKTLATQVAELVKNMPADKAERASRDLAVFTDEAVSKEPRMGLCEMSGDGLISAAKTVAEMAGPITSAVKAVLALLT